MGFGVPCTPNPKRGTHDPLFFNPPPFIYTSTPLWDSYLLHNKSYIFP